jgi:hypothetical protein
MLSTVNRSLGSQNRAETKLKFVKSDIFTAVKIQVEVFWVVTPCSVVVDVSDYHAASIFRMATKHSETLVSYRNSLSEPRRPRLKIKANK